jgi:hypothetical protein
MVQTNNPKRGPGRPKIEDGKDSTIFCRVDLKTHDALSAFARRTGIDTVSIALRSIIVERLRAEGLLQ